MMRITCICSHQQLLLLHEEFLAFLWLHFASILKGGFPIELHRYGTLVRRLLPLG